MQMNALQRLIVEHMERTGETYSDIAARGRMPRQTLSALINRPPKAMPRGETLTSLARGLRLPLALVRSAAVESVAGEHTPPPPNAVVLAQLVESLPERDVLVLLAAARALVGNAQTG